MNQFTNICFNKIEINQTHLYITYDRSDFSKNLLILSHGSGGINYVTLNIAHLACENNYDVIILDHFTKRNISTLHWDNLKEKCNFFDMAEDIKEIISKINYENILLLGISAGATSCINASKFSNKVLAISPALSFDITSDIKNVTIIAGTRDDWCPIEQARKYKNKTNCELIELPCHHGYLEPGKDKFLHNSISLKEGFPKGVTLKYNKYSADRTYEIIKNFLQDSFYS